MIRFEHVTKTYPNQVVAVHDIDFEVEEGDFVSIVGKSGAGKSTLLRLITREEITTHGRVLIEDVDVSQIASNDLPYLRRKIGVVYQDMKLLPKRTSAENVAFAMEVSGVPRKQIDSEVPKLLELVGLSEKLNAFPGQLSGGEQQRVAIARALAHKPLLFLADEPTGNLDQVNAMEILGILKRINSMGTTVVLATHAKDLVDKVKKRVLVIEDGEIISDVKSGKYKLK